MAICKKSIYEKMHEILIEHGIDKPFATTQYLIHNLYGLIKDDVLKELKQIEEFKHGS